MDEGDFSSALLDTVGALVVVCDREGRVVRFNRACEETTGYTFAEVNNKPYDIFLTLEEAHWVKAAFYRILSGEFPNAFESQLVTKEGNLRLIAWSNTALVRDGQVEFVIGTGIDITEREKAERHIAHLASFPQLNPSPVLEVDLSGRITFYNAATLKTLKRLGSPGIVEAFLPEDMETVLQEAKKTGESWFQREVRIGDFVFAESISFPAESQAARIYAYDITERKQVEEAAEVIRRQQEAILNNISDLAWLKDREGRYIKVNEPFCQITGFKPEDIVGKTDFDFWPQYLAKKYRADDQEVMRTGKKKRVEEPQADKDGDLYWVETIKSPIFNEHHEVVGTTGIARDISERRRAEEALKESQQELRRLTSQLLSIQEKERRRLARELHDELGQALTVLKIQLVAIEGKLTLNQHPLKANCEKMLAYIDTVIENVRRLSWDLSPSSLEDLGLSTALRSLVEETCRNQNLQCSVEMDKIDHLFSPEVKINIYRIFQESLTNVVKHARASQVSVKISRENGQVSFMIRDDGRGFNMKQAMSGKSTKRSLGLTAINERVLMAQGSLQVASRRGRGTTIAFAIPTINQAGTAP